MRSRGRPALGRRAFLASGGLVTAALATGCGAVDDFLDDGPDPASAPESESSDERLVAAALSDQERLLATCLAVRARHGSVRAALGPLVEHHRTHVRILGGEPSHRRARSGVSSSARDALKALRGDEGGAARRRARDALRAESGELARVLAAIGASERQHEYVLDEAIGALS